MGKDYTLAGEDFFREMMRAEEERRRHLADNGDGIGGIGGGSHHPSNVVSLQDYRRQHAERRPYRVVPLKPST
jgi:hypothetical protein